jgi:hypothetical protein
MTCLRNATRRLPCGCQGATRSAAGSPRPPSRSSRCPPTRRPSAGGAPFGAWCRPSIGLMRTMVTRRWRTMSNSSGGGRSVAMSPRPCANRRRRRLPVKFLLQRLSTAVLRTRDSGAEASICSIPVRCGGRPAVLQQHLPMRPWNAPHSCRNNEFDTHTPCHCRPQGYETAAEEFVS